MLRDALIVGVNTYQNLPGLKAPAKDAEAVAKTLHTYGEFRVHRLPEVIQSGQPQIGQKTQVTLQMLESALVQLFKPKGRSVAQTALFYFSGHGLQREAGIREGFLAPSNADPDRGFYGLSLFWLRRLLQESPVRQRIIILDCCHSGELLNFLEADPGATPGTDRLFMAASREYETAYESIDSPYSVFTQALLAGLEPNRSATGIVNHYMLTDWVNHQLKGEIQQPLFESSGSEIILTRRLAAADYTSGYARDQVGEATVFQGSIAGQPQRQVTQLSGSQLSGNRSQPEMPSICPYRGLDCFDESHTEFFFGREALTVELLQKIKAHSFVSVVGASGIGKSSLVRAGLIPLLRQTSQRHTDPIWQVKLLTPGEHPLKSLAAAFVDPAAHAIERAEQLRRAEQLLESGEAGFVQLVRGSLPQNFGSTGLSPNPSKLLLVVDQFEEIFTLGATQADREKQLFIDYLTTAFPSLADHLKVVVVLRADFVSECRQYSSIAKQIAQRSVIVPPLKYEQLKAAIVRPAQKAGLRCEPNLVYTLLLDIMGAPGELALLQSTLLQLWQRRQSTPEGIDCLTLDSYRELGGIRQLLPERATALFQQFDTTEQAIAQRIFLALTHFGDGTEDTRRRVSKSQLLNPAVAPEKAELVERILEKLVSAKLLVTDQAGTHSTEPSDQRDRELSDAALASPAVYSSNADSSSHDSIHSIAENPASHHQTHDQKPTDQTNERAHRQPHLLRRHQTPSITPEKPLQAVVDVAHEVLIRHWPLLRQWCDRDREKLRQQRGLEEAAQIWYAAGQPASVEFLLAGQKLQEAEELAVERSEELSALTQEYILASREEAKRLRREARQLQIAVPAFLVATLAIILGQYFNALQSQAEKDQQLRLATARERAAITQTILQDGSRAASGSLVQDAVAALLIGRLAAQEEPTNAAQVSLRQALQRLRFQFELPTLQSAVQHLEMSPDRQHLAVASADGKIRLWSLQPHRLYRSTSAPEPGQTLDWTMSTAQSPGQTAGASLRVSSVRFSPDSQSIAAFAEGLPDIKIWSTRYGALLLHLKGSAPVTQIQFSPTGEWLVSAHADFSLAIWRSDTGQLVSRLLNPKPIEAVQFSPDGQFLWVGLASDTRRYRLIPAADDFLRLQPAPLPVQSTQIQQAVFSPQGKWIASLNPAGQVNLWRSQTGQLLRRFPATNVEKLQFSPNDQTLAILTRDTVLLYSLSTNRLRSLPIRPTQGTELAFSQDGRWLLTRSGQGNAENQQVVQIWNGESGEGLGLLQDSKITTAGFSPDNTYLITGDAEGKLKFWAVQAGGELPTLEQANSPAAWISFMQNGFDPNSSTQLLTIAANGQLQPWQLPAAVPGVSPRSIPALEVHTAAIEPQNFWQKLTALASPGGGVAEAKVALWSRASVGQSSEWGKQPESDDRTPTKAEPTDFPRAESGWRQTISQVFGSASRLEAASVLASQTPFSSVALSDEGQWLATADRSGTVIVQQRQPNRTFQTKYRIQNWQIGSRSPLSQVIAGNFTPSSASAQSSLAKPSSAKPQLRVNIRQLHFSPDQQLLLGVGDDDTLRLWRVEAGELVQTWHSHRAMIHQARFSPDGSHIITASQDRTAQILAVPLATSTTPARTSVIDPASSNPIAILRQDTAVTSSSFSLDSQQLATGGEDGKARIYDRTTGELRWILAGHQGAITDLQYSPDGSSIVTTSMDGTAIVWNARTGEQQGVLNPIRNHQKGQPLVQAAFSPEGQYVATLTATGQVYLWAATWEHLLTLAQERTPRQLTPEECTRYLKLSVDQCPKLAL